MVKLGSRPFCAVATFVVVFLSTSTSVTSEKLGNLKAPDAGNWTVGDCILAQVSDSTLCDPCLLKL